VHSYARRYVPLVDALLARGPNGCVSPVVAVTDYETNMAGNGHLWQVMRTAAPVEGFPTTLLDQIRAGKPRPEHLVIGSELVVRESTAGGTPPRRSRKPVAGSTRSRASLEQGAQLAR
jgi:hypothetical protein